MRKYQIYINGENFLMMNEGSKILMGFYTTRWVEASSSEEAEMKAIKLIKNDQSLRRATLNEKEDPLMLYVEEISELENFEGVNPPGAGYTFYPDEKESK